MITNRLYARDNLIDLEYATRFYKGGGAPAMPAPAAPPPTASATEVQMQRRDTLRNNAAKRGIQSTLLAGEAIADSDSPQRKATLLSGM